MVNLATGLSAIRASQTALDTTGNNIANASTPGYHRQIARLVNRPPVASGGLLLGNGVDVARVDRLIDSVLEAALTQNISDAAAVGDQLAVLRQIESLVTSGSGSLANRLQGFFDSLQELSARPFDQSQRLIVLKNADLLAKGISELANQISKLTTSLDSAIAQTVRDINTRMADLAEVNRQISVAHALGKNPNDLLDLRGQLLNDLAGLVDVELQEHGQSASVLLASQGQLLIGSQTAELKVGTTADSSIQVTYGELQQGISPAGGKLAGLLEARNNILPGFLEQLESFTASLVGAVNSVHATGVGTSGGFTALTGTKGVANAGLPLAGALPAALLESGDLYIAVTDVSTGERTLTRLSIDPSADSLQDVAAALNSVPHLSAAVNTQTGTLRIFAEAGFKFDFAGGVDSAPTAGTFTGTSTPRFDGFYAGPGNQQFELTVVGSGTVGVTPGLTIQVRDGSGNLVATLDVGQNYEPGSNLQLPGGISVAFSSGTVNSGDVLPVQFVADPDETGLLAALGMNAFFVGNGMYDLRVNPELTANPGLFATTFSGESGDIGNLKRLVELRDSPLASAGGRSLTEKLTGIITGIGSDVAELEQIQNYHQLMNEHLSSEQQQLSGVDPNEELLRMVQFQRSFQIAARYLMTLDEVLEDMISLLR